MNAEEIRYFLALTQIRGIGHVHARMLIRHFGSAKSVFESSVTILQTLRRLKQEQIRSITNFNQWDKVNRLTDHLARLNIQVVPFHSPDFPLLLSQCSDAPMLLFVKGNLPCNEKSSLGMVGTRTPSDYGKRITQLLVRNLSHYPINIISGMAAGVDAIAHEEALQQGVSTFGILAHGLDHIYPSHHRKLADAILAAGGGLLSEYPPYKKADRFHFPDRNRIIAGMSQQLIVIESSLKGGSLITATCAYRYNRSVIAVPGRYGEEKSKGCNWLIGHQKAQILHSIEQITRSFPSQMCKKSSAPLHIWNMLSEPEKNIMQLFQQQRIIHFDEILLRTVYSIASLSKTLLELELKGYLVCLPGKYYQQGSVQINT